MKKVGIVIKESNPNAVTVASDVTEWFAGRGVDVYGLTSLAGNVSGMRAAEGEDFVSDLDLMVVLGGDGTMLGAARMLGGRAVPILGVNLGSLGFLTAIKEDEMFPVLEKLFKDECECGSCSTEERMALNVIVRRKGEVIGEHRVMNDVVLRGKSTRLVSHEVSINKDYVNTYRADGLIISTPTGSTAYALSAAGPILYPTIDSIIVVPICPFNLTNRPVVVPDWMVVEVSLKEGDDDIQLVMDGQVKVDVLGGDSVEVRKAEESIYLVQYSGKSYFDILRERLSWEVNK